MANINTPNKANKLSPKEQAFCREYVKSGNGTQSVYKAGYNAKTDNMASTIYSRLIRKDKVQAEIAKLQERKNQSAIMSSQQVMEMFTKIANGEVKDQFGLDASLNDRLKALQELAKRTIDIDNRIKGIADTNINIKVDWQR